MSSYRQPMQPKAKRLKEGDFFPTPPWMTWELHNLTHRIKGRVWEPACGNMDMANELKKFAGVRQVVATDLYPKRPRQQPMDFMTCNLVPCDWVVTNPPYLLGEEFAHRGLAAASQGVALLLRLQFLEGQGRHHRLFSVTPPSTVGVFIRRARLAAGRVAEKGEASMETYAWFVWDKASRGGTRVKWIGSDV